MTAKISHLINCDGIQQLVNAAGSKFLPALEVLFVNRRNTPKFRIFPQKEMCGLIELEGSTKGLHDALRLVTLARSTFSMGVETLLPDYFDPLINLRQGLGLLGDKLTPQRLLEMTHRMREFELEQPPSLFEKSTLDFYVAVVLDSLISTWRSQPSIFGNKEVIKCLQDLELITPRLQLSLCTKCHNFELLMGSQHLGSSKCLKCNKKRICVRVYLFREDLSELKIEDRDLPCFVYNYMKRFGARVHVWNWLGPDLEANVYVPDSDTDIECTTFLREKLAIDDEDVKGVAGNLVREKIERKLETLHSKGIKRILFVTNLSVDDSTRLERQITEKLSAKDIEIEVNVVPHDLKRFIAKLDEEISIARHKEQGDADTSIQ